MVKVASRVGRLARLSLLALLIAALGLVIAPGPRASAATTTSLTSATSNAKLATAISTAKYTSAGTAVISEDVSGAVHVAANYSARKNLPLLVATSGTSPSDVVPQLQKWATKSVYLVSRTADYFTSQYRTALTEAGISVTSYYQNTDAYALWVQAAEPSKTSEYVFARTDNAVAYRLATAYAGSRGSALIIYSATTPVEDLASLFTSIDGSTLIFYGDPAVIPKDQMSDAQTEDLLQVDTADRRRAAVWTGERLQYLGRTSNDIVTAPTSAIADVAFAALRARHRGGIALPAGTRTAITTDSPLADYLALWRNETVRLELVGLNTTTDQLTSISAPTQLTRSSSPSFRSTGLTYSDTTKKWSLTVTSVTGATKYVAYDLMGAVVVQSSSTTLVLPTQPSNLLITAESSTAVKSSFNLVVNSYKDATQRSSVVLGQVKDGTAYLLVLNTAKTPRLITRTAVDTFGVDGPETPVAITCASSFTEKGLNPAVQYKYNVVDFTNVGVKACDSTLAAGAGTGTTNLAGMPLPPDSTSATAAKKMAAPTLQRAPAVKNALARRQQRTAAAVPMGEYDWNQWPDVLIRWRAYIPSAKVPVGPSKDFLKPLLALGGDNAGSDPNGSARFTQTARVRFGDDHGISYSETMGESHSYKCTPILTNCTELNHGTASLDTLNFRNLSSTVNFADMKFDASAGVPLLRFSQYFAIDTSWEVYFSYYSSWAWGTHDNMPEHELWVGSAQSEWFRIYKSPYAGYAQAPCLFNPHGSSTPPCGTFFNVSI